MSFYELKQQVLNWGFQKGIVVQTDEQAKAQFTKVQEELHELIEAFTRYSKNKTTENLADTKLELGDLLVTIIIVAACMGIDMDDALTLAYNKIKARTGKVVDGIFVKDS